MLLLELTLEKVRRLELALDEPDSEPAPVPEAGDTPPPVALRAKG